MSVWIIILGAFAGSLFGAAAGLAIIYAFIGYFSRKHTYTGISSEIQERVEAAKRRYGISDFDLDEETLELGMEPE